MKCITICQPYAHAIVHGTKDIENRKWSCSYRGPLLIHAGKSKDWFSGGSMSDGSPEPSINDCVFGAIVGVCKLRHINMPSQRILMETNPWAYGPECWKLTDRMPFSEAISYRGQQGLFDVPDDLVAEQLKNWEGFNHA